MSRVFWVALACGLFVWLVHPAQARETRPICAKYETQTGWSKGYRVDGHYYRGHELNEAARSAAYDIGTSYMVIFWSQGQASVIDIGWTGAFPLYLTEGTDQEGRKWQIGSSSFCY